MGEMNIDRRTFVGAMGALGALSLAGVGPVSYTHLDVYKRQPMISGVATTRKNATCTHDTHASTPNDSSPRCVRGPGRDAAAGRCV